MYVRYKEFRQHEQLRPPHPVLEEESDHYCVPAPAILALPVTMSLAFYDPFPCSLGFYLIC